ncbi:hypothetical protein LD125_00323 [Mesoplasma sp. JKS002658]|nr:MULTISPECIES: hypothetical protein [unclassified Mesoplasma]MCL8212934.1 hypothetical protein [Mesoplasma sp. JKS002661]MCL8213184.1 hypothetical protein [Mesoplasma sp. JKS002660]MCL8216133.1 hypothetical protein [Mesoplasma sp. JKS002657]MCL8211173.1 hypothetical protein [Mesoplasma sp. JKS002664]MCL8211834.1 hypothetical protein [Mesoplasma sp. JKS002662]
MSYYQQASNFEYSDHGLQRVKERLKMKDKTDWEVREEVRRLVNLSTHGFEDNHYYYVGVGKSKDMFFVFSKDENVLITCTKISVEKQMKLISKGLN